MTSLVAETSNRFDRVCLILTPLFILTQYLAFLILHYVCKWRPAVTKDAIKALAGRDAKEMTPAAWRTFHIDASQLLWSGFFHCAFGSAAVVAALGFDDNAPIRALGDRGALMAAGDLQYIRLQESATVLGSIFGALMLSYLFYWCCGWDKGMEQLFHHLTFFGVTIVLARRSALPQSGLWAMAMEASSPALNAMNILRQLEGRETGAMLAFVVFILLFFLLRCVLFGKVVLRTCYLRLFDVGGFPLHVPAWEIDVVVMLWLAGWLLQLYWLRAILKKLQRRFARSTKED